MKLKFGMRVKGRVHDTTYTGKVVFVTSNELYGVESEAWIIRDDGVRGGGPDGEWVVYKTGGKWGASCGEGVLKKDGPRVEPLPWEA